MSEPVTVFWRVGGYPDDLVCTTCKPKMVIDLNLMRYGQDRAKESAVLQAAAHAATVHGMAVRTYEWEGQPMADQNKITIAGDML